MKHKCLYCYEALQGEVDYHKKCSLTFFGTIEPPYNPYTIDQMEELAKNVVERSISIPGVQAKLSMSMIKDVQKNARNRLTIVGALGGQYIFKTPSEEFPEMPENEHVTMKVAESFGIKTAPCSLLRLASGELSYITRRIDRSGQGEKIHMLDMFQITDAVDKYKSSMEKVGKAIHNYSHHTMLDKILLFELLVFCFLTGNNDMHLKNFSMILSPSGWILAPAYDLLNVAIVLPKDTEELALTMEGKKKQLKWSHFERFAKGLALTDKQIQGVYKRMISNKPKAFDWIDRCFLSDKMKVAYKHILNSRYEQL